MEERLIFRVSDVERPVIDNIDNRSAPQQKLVRSQNLTIELTAFSAFTRLLAESSELKGLEDGIAARAWPQSQALYDEYITTML